MSESEAFGKGVDLSYIIDAYSAMTVGKEKFFNSFFDKLIGNRTVRKMIVAGKSADEIRASWHDEVEEYKQLRSKYLIYPEK